jgi:hypothetical protein
MPVAALGLHVYRDDKYRRVDAYNGSNFSFQWKYGHTG